MDVTDWMEVIKYDPEALEESKQVTKKKYGPFMRFLFKFPFLKAILLPKKVRGKWPEFVAHTDETRAQVLNYVFEKYKGLPVYVTVKKDGQSATYFHNKKEFGVCSRNLRLPPPAKNRGNYSGMQSKYWENARKYDIEAKLRQASKDMGINLYIQGEQCGPGIQGNKYQYKELKLFIFNIYDITHKRYFSWEQIKKFCETYSFDTVPFVEYTDFPWKDVDELVEYAKGFDPDGDKVLREGIVIRSVVPMPPDNMMANMMSFKVINPDFSLKYGLNDYSDKGAASGGTGSVG
jgi:RNA ligase (TIGR02306 family)